MIPKSALRESGNLAKLPPRLNSILVGSPVRSGTMPQATINHADEIAAHQ